VWGQFSVFQRTSRVVSFPPPVKVNVGFQIWGFLGIEVSVFFFDKWPVWVMVKGLGIRLSKIK
jgi:hypothetical protein